jgi:hypothetical protein
MGTGTAGEDAAAPKRGYPKTPLSLDRGQAGPEEKLVVGKPGRTRA